MHTAWQVQKLKAMWKEKRVDDFLSLLSETGSDFGGKREASDKNSIETASRWAAEMSGG